MSCLKPTTIEDHIRCGYAIHAYCHGYECSHHTKLDLYLLAARLGPDHRTMHHDLVPKLRCSKCGSKDVSIRLSPTGN